MFVRKAKYDALEAQHEETLRELAEVRGKLERILAPLKAANATRKQRSEREARQLADALRTGRNDSYYQLNA